MNGDQHFVVTLHFGEMALYRNNPHVLQGTHITPSNRGHTRSRQPCAQASSAQTLILPVCLSPCCGLRICEATSADHHSCFPHPLLTLPIYAGRTLLGRIQEPTSIMRSLMLYLFCAFFAQALGEIGLPRPPPEDMSTGLHFYWALSWAELCPSQNSYIEVLTSNVTVLEMESEQRLLR